MTGRSPPMLAPFEHPPPHADGADTGSFLPGDFEAQYEQLFAEALEEGEITAEERERLNLAASALGLDAERVLRLENALLAAYEGRAAITLGDASDPGTLGDMAPLTHRPHSPSFDDRPTPVALVRPKPPDENDALHERYLACGRAGDLDAQLLTAAVLVHRQSARRDEKKLFETYLPRTPPRPVRALTTDGWARLLHPDEDRQVGEIFAIIASAALLGRVSAMRRDRSLPELDPEKRQDPQTSTISAVRALAWAAATLGMRAPPTYVAPEHDGGFAIAMAVPPAMRVGAQVLAGQTAIQLAFHCARHLTWFREEHFVCTLVPTIGYLEDLFLAALTIGAPSIDLTPEARARVALTVDAIIPVLDAPRLAHLKDAATRFLAQGGRTMLKRWAQAAEWTALRAGLLLCGDLETACEIVRRDTNGNERVRELERFWASDDSSELRRQLGIAIG